MNVSALARDKGPCRLRRFIRTLENRPRFVEENFPASVSRTEREFLSNNCTPSSSSRSRICRLRAGCATRNFVAALVKFRCSATDTK